MGIQQNEPLPTREKELETLEKRYPIRYRTPRFVPIQFQIKGNALRIRFFVRYCKSMLENYPGTTTSYADIAEAGIRTNWSKKYPFPWLSDDGYERAHARASFRVLTNEPDPSDKETEPEPPSVRVTFEFIRANNTKMAEQYPKQRYVYFCMTSSELFPAHVISPIWRWFWGFFRTFQLESIQLNWSCRHPGKVKLARENNRHNFQQACAHEAGHLFGIGDAYGANYRFYYEAPGTAKYIMCHNRRVDPEELDMALRAHLHNKMSFFPRKFSPRIYLLGFRRAFRLQFTRLSRIDKAHSVRK